MFAGPKIIVNIANKETSIAMLWSFPCKEKLILVDVLCYFDNLLLIHCGQKKE